MSNILTIGRRLQMTRYVAIVKNVFAQDRHEVLELHGFGDIGMSKLTQVVNVLTNWGYVQVVKIKTTVDPALKIQLKRTADFQEKYDTFAKALEERRDERNRLKEEEAAKADAQEESKEEQAPETEAGSDAKETPPAEESSK